MLGILVSMCVWCVVCVSGASLELLVQVPADSTVSAIEQAIINDGFPAETHHVETSDGYILEMHRIPHGRNNADSTTNRPVVFLMHGLMGASDAYILLGPEYSMAYNLADAGFDVWMGNARGNRFSRRHLNLNPDHETERFIFFDFTWEEIGLHDLPAMMDYALDYTGNHQLHYIGHSQGGTVFMVLTTLRPEYQVKIASAHFLAAAGYTEHFPDEALILISADIDNLYLEALDMGIVELFPVFLLPPSITSRNVSDYCTGDYQQRHMCERFGIKHILGNKWSYDDTPEYILGGAALKQAVHYGQTIRDKLFRRYHHGTDENRKRYGLEYPPLYDLKTIRCDVTMHYSMSDDVLDERDVLAMVADMPNARARRVARDSFEHSDYILSLDAKELVTDYIIEAMKNTPILDPETSTDLDPVNIYDPTESAGDTPASISITYGQISLVTDAISTTPGSASKALLNLSLILISSIILVIKYTN